MKPGLRAFVVGALMWSAPALSADDDPDGSGFSGQKLPDLELPAGPPPGPVDVLPPELAARLQAEGGPKYDARVYLGAEALKLEPAFVQGVREGLDLLYRREYQASRKHFRELEERYPGTALSAVADTLVWQALMLENFDLRFDKQYQVASKEAMKGLEAAMKQPGGEAWEHILLGGLVGIEAIHSLRQYEIVKALQLAFDAMDHIGRAREAAPDFVDLQLAEGMYNYWRSVFTMTSSMLPSFDDRRLEGVQQMQLVQQRGVFLAPLANMAMVYTWREEDELARAIATCQTNRDAYPDSIINNLLMGSTYIKMRKFDEALALFDEVSRVDPQNDRVRYWRGVALLKSGQPAQAEPEFQAYLRSEHIEKWQRSNAHYRLGQVYNRMDRHAEAYDQFKTASKVDGHKGAKRAMARLEERRKAGKITF